MHPRQYNTGRLGLLLLVAPSVIQAFSTIHSEKNNPNPNPEHRHTPNNNHVWNIPSSAQVLSQDPLIYTIPNLLTPEECQTYMDYVFNLPQQQPPQPQQKQQQSIRSLKQSNPPQVSLEISKLWPLPLFSLAAGIPSILKKYSTLLSLDLEHGGRHSMTPLEMLDTAQGPISIALFLSVLLVGLAQPIIQAISNRTARTSVAVALNQPEDIAMIRPLVQKVCKTTGHVNWEAWEAPVVTRYDPGAIFARHGDASPTLGSEWEQEGGQRVITCICYLNDLVGGGGETYFDQLQIAVSPQPGMALIFFPADHDTKRADTRTTHESLPPSDQEKWIVQMFGRIGPRVPPPLGIPEEFHPSKHTRREKEYVLE